MRFKYPKPSLQEEKNQIRRSTLWTSHYSSEFAAFMVKFTYRAVTTCRSPHESIKHPLLLLLLLLFQVSNIYIEFQISLFHPCMPFPNR